jgi:hypothetical protein
MDLMWFLLLGHLTGDFALQSDHMAQRKGTSIAVLTAHVIVYTLCIAVGLYGFRLCVGVWGAGTALTGLLLALLFSVHWAQDFIKSRYFHSRQAFYVDQTLHVLQLFALRWLLM